MKTIKSLMSLAAMGFVVVTSQSTRAALLFTTSDSINYSANASGLTQVISDNNPSGLAYALNFGTSGLTITGVSVSFATSGGYNGDIYAYLSNGSTLVQLVNQITGAPGTSGFNVTLAGGTANPIQTATGTAGQVLSGVTFTAAQNLSAFNGIDPNGSWTLFFADLSAGDTSTLNSFSVSFETSAVPEPANLALSLFGVVFIGIGTVRHFRKMSVPSRQDDRNTFSSLTRKWDGE